MSITEQISPIVFTIPTFTTSFTLHILQFTVRQVITVSKHSMSARE